MRNQYGGTCYRCGEWCAPGKGHFERQRGTRIWRVQHAECAIKYRNTDHEHAKPKTQVAVMSGGN